MKYLLIFSLSLLLSCSKQKSMEQRPLKAVPTASVNGKVITLTADKSEGDVCAYGWGLHVNSPQGATVTFSPSSSAQGVKNSDGTYQSGTLTFIPITATVNKTGNYTFSLQVLDSKKNEAWENITIEVK